MSDLKLASWFEFDEHKHLFTKPDGTPIASIVFSRLADGRDNAVNCMASVKILFAADDPSSVEPVMEYQRCNLTNKGSVNGWGKVAQALEVGYSNIGWDSQVQRAISASLKNWYEGSTSYSQMERVDPSTVAAPFLINPWVSSTGMTMHFSRPGSSKSMTALAIAVSVATGYPIFGATPSNIGPVVYVDFEDDISQHNIRLTAILNGIDWTGDTPDITHYKVNGRLVDNTSQIRRLVREKGAALVIVDSLGKARNTDPSDGDATIKLTNAIESFGIPVLAIDHVTKVDNAAIAKQRVTHPDAMMAIGSQFSTAGARLGWFFQEMGDSTYLSKRYNVFNTKHNHVAKQEPRSLKIDFINNERGIPVTITFDVWDTVKFEEFRAETIEETVLIWMVRNDVGKATATQIANETGLDRTSVSRVLGSSEWFEKAGKQTKKGQFYEVTEEGGVQYAHITGHAHP